MFDPSFTVLLRESIFIENPDCQMNFFWGQLWGAAIKQDWTHKCVVEEEKKKKLICCECESYLIQSCILPCIYCANYSSGNDSLEYMRVQ